MRLEFRLIYKGSLKAAGSGSGGTRSKEKHEIRRYLHRQLAEFWEQNPFLRNLKNSVHREIRAEDCTVESRASWLDNCADNYERFGYKCVPLINEDSGLACSLDILFLRRDNPGGFVKSGGDIDNRLKVLFDAFRLPHTKEEVAGYMPESHEEPFFVLMEDDKLITDVRITTDRLNLPMESEESIHDVFLVIKVTTKIVNINAAYMEFLS